MPEATKEALPDRMADMFHGRTVFITGGSGFLGKLLIEKILYQCDGVKAIYLLMRNKKGKSPQERMADIFSNVVFDRLKLEKPGALAKCHPIAGDVTEQDLGIGAEDRQLLRDTVDFIYHSAASTRFDDTVRVAARMNTRGTKYMLDLAHECKKLKVFVHVSTAYAHPKEKVLYERTYKPLANPHEILKSIDFDKEDDNESEILNLKLLKDCPNTYTFTKALAEELVAESMDRLPSIILRPSVVCPTLKHPFPGWCNNLQGPMGIFVGAGKGVIRSMHLKSDTYADFIPADICINGFIACTWNFLNFDRQQRVYNVTASSEYNLSWEEIIEIGKDVIYNQVPFNGILWYPGGSPKRSKLVHNICFYLFQIVPALFIDALLIVLGYKPILYGIQRRIQKGSEMFEYYTNRTWNFSNEKLVAITARYNERERASYRLDGDDLDIKKYFFDCVMSLRRNNLKETDEMLPAAKRNMKIMYCLDVFCKSLFVLMVLYYSYKWILAPVFRI